jgi:hypothetical protein
MLGNHSFRIANVALFVAFTLSACQTTTSEITSPPPRYAATNIEKSDQTTINNNTFVRTVVVTEKAPKKNTLSVLKITDGSGCPARDPSTYGVFLRSEKSSDAVLCYYD